MVALVVVPEVQAGSGQGGVHDDEVGEGVGRVLHHAEACEQSGALSLVDGVLIGGTLISMLAPRSVISGFHALKGSIRDALMP